MEQYTHIKAMPLAAFLHLVATLAHETTEHHDGGTTIPQDSAESIAFVISCMYAQRLNLGVGTAETLEALQTDKFMDYANRLNLAGDYYAALTN